MFLLRLHTWTIPFAFQRLHSNIYSPDFVWWWLPFVDKRLEMLDQSFVNNCFFISLSLSLHHLLSLTFNVLLLRLWMICIRFSSFLSDAVFLSVYLLSQSLCCFVTIVVFVWLTLRGSFATYSAESCFPLFCPSSFSSSRLSSHVYKHIITLFFFLTGLLNCLPS